MDMRVAILLTACWGILLTSAACSALVPVPFFMKCLLQEVEMKINAKSETDDPIGHFQTLARSFSPSSVETDSSGLTLNFKLDPWSESEDRQRWVVLSWRQHVNTRGSGAGISVVLDDGSPQGIALIRSRSNQLFLRFNITTTSLPVRSNEYFAVRVNTKNSRGGALFGSEVVHTSGVEFGPLLVMASKALTGSMAVGTTRRTRRDEPSVIGTAVLAEVVAAEAALLSTRPGCRLQTWSVATEELGWNWLIYPYDLSLNLCVGTCPVPLIDHSLNPSNHAVARNILRSIAGGNRTQGHPDIHCVPIRFHKMSLLLETEPGNYTLVTSDDLSASRCGCR